MPSTSTDRLNGLTTSVAIKPPCRVATTANITLYGEQTIDSVAVVEGDRVLVKDQTSAWQNGIYVAATGAWTRAKDFDGNRDVVQGTIVLVRPASSGTLFYEVQTANPIVIGTSNITFAAADPGVETLLANLADPTSASNGAGMSGFSFLLTYAANTLGWALSLVSRSEVNILRYIPVAEWAAIFDYTSTYDCAPALQAAVDTELKVVLPRGLVNIGSTVTVDYQGCTIEGSGWTTTGTTIRRFTDTSFGPLITVSAGGVAEGFCISGLKFIDQNGLSSTNTSPHLQIGANDFIVRGVWFLNGYKGLYLPQAASNAHIEGNTFEACRKQAIDCYSAGLLKIIGNTFWKNTADISNPSDRSATITLRKDAAYSFGTSDVTITGNYFLETVYGHHIWVEGSDGVTVSANFLCIASQVDPGQRDDIYIKDSSRVTINGNTGTKLFNSYSAGNRGSRYFVNIDTGCSDITIAGNAVEAGISGTINDPNNLAKVILDQSSGLVLPNTANSNKRVLDFYQEYLTADVTLGITFGGGNTGITYSSRECVMQRIGNFLVGSLTIVLSSKGSSTGSALITGLPVTAANNASLQSAVYVRYNSMGSFTPNAGRVLSNSTTIALDKISAGTSTQLADTDFTNTSIVSVSFSYPVA